MFVTLEEFQISLLVKSAESDKAVRIMSRLIKSRAFREQLATAVRNVVQCQPELKNLRIKIGR